MNLSLELCEGTGDQLDFVLYMQFAVKTFAADEESVSGYIEYSL